MYTVRRTEERDLEAVMRIYERAVVFMRASGNLHQWGNGYPGEELILADIKAGWSFAIEQDGEILAVFAYIEGEDPTYRRIEQGGWLTSGSYGTVHRLASAGTESGMAKVCFDCCAEMAREHGCVSLRVDTHRDNTVMQHLVEKYGFLYCGVIYIADGSPRLAYERVVADGAE